MCGIIGILAQTPVADSLLSALARLEYRGYDSAGIATLERGVIVRRRAKGKLQNLRELVAEQPLHGTSGIGHSRWATHGKPTVENAHPHVAGRVAVVHNGIIENFKELREELLAKGVNFESDTDTECIAHLCNGYLQQSETPKDAVQKTLARLRGAYALAFLFEGEDDLLICARAGSPLAIATGENAAYLGSDALALSPFSKDIIYLEEGDWAVLKRGDVTIYDSANSKVERASTRIPVEGSVVEKGKFRHYMAKEIHEQPDVVSHTLGRYINFASGDFNVDFDFSKISRLSLSACGTAYYAALTARYWFEAYAGLPVDIDIASEFRYREAPLDKHGMALVISQSGETADTLAVLRYCKGQGQKTAALLNVPTSTMAREADVVFRTLAGTEIGVASTKAFTCQLAALACLAIAAGQQRGVLTQTRARELSAALIEAPRKIAEALDTEHQMERIAAEISGARSVLYLGRGTSFPLALEGALKLKEISYLHAEGYAAGELKHGPIALIDDDVPVIVIAPHDGLFDKTLSNLQEVTARGGKVILITDSAGRKAASDTPHVIVMPDVADLIAPLVYAIPIQLLAYHTARVLGTDIDQPRNLAKSVTVE